MKIVHPAGFELEMEVLAQVIVAGKKNGWASGEKPYRVSNMQSHKGYAFETFFGVGNFPPIMVHNDSYRGKGRFMGEELTSVITRPERNQIPIWGMNYFGVLDFPQEIPVEDQETFKKEVNAFLTEQLMKVPLDMPFRGPVHNQRKETQWGTLSYNNTPDIADKKVPLRTFTGHEEINIITEGYLSHQCLGFNYRGGLLVPDEWIKK